MGASVDAGTIIVDSLKDAAIGLTDDEVGAGWNRARQGVLTDGMELVELHHQRKGTKDSPPDTLADVYGSTWITAGAGSVILLWGQAGDLVVKFKHLKQPLDEVGPFDVIHDHTTGVSRVDGGFDPLQYLKLRGADGSNANEAAMRMTSKSKPSKNDREKARRELERLASAGLATRSTGTRGGADGGIPTRYYIDELAP